MKKIKVLSILMPLFAMSLTGCGTKDGEKGEGKMEFNNTNHWTVAEDGTIDEKAKHTFEEDKSKGKAATCAAEGEKVEKCTVCGYEKKTTLSKLSHEFVEDAAASTTSTCSVPGKKVEKCKNCTEKKETDLPLAAHTLSGAGTEKTEGERTYFEFECSTCHNKVSTLIAFNTMTVEAGSFEDGKISQDPVGRIAWNVQLPAGFYDVYFEAKFSSSSGANRTFETRKVEVTYNGATVEFDKSKTAEEVGLDSSNYKAFNLCTIKATGGIDKMTLENPNYRLVFNTEGYINFKPVLKVS